MEDMGQMKDSFLRVFLINLSLNIMDVNHSIVIINCKCKFAKCSVILECYIRNIYVYIILKVFVFITEWNFISIQINIIY